MKKAFSLILVASISGSMSALAVSNQAIVIPNLVNRFNNNQMTITPNSPFAQANQWVFTHPNGGENQYFVAPNLGGSLSAFPIPNPNIISGANISRAPRGSATGNGLIYGFNPPYRPTFGGFGRSGQSVYEGNGYRGGSFVAGPFETGHAGEFPSRVPNTSVPGPAVNANPGPAVNANPGPAVNANPGPAVNANPGPAVNANPLPPGSSSMQNQNRSGESQNHFGESGQSRFFVVPNAEGGLSAVPVPNPEIFSKGSNEGHHNGGAQSSTPGIPGGTTPGVPGGTTPGVPGGTTPGVPGGTTPGVPGGTTPGVPGGTTPGAGIGGGM